MGAKHTHERIAIVFGQLLADHIVPRGPHIIPRVRCPVHLEDDLIVEILGDVARMPVVDGDLTVDAGVIAVEDASAQGQRTAHRLVVAVAPGQCQRHLCVTVAVAVDEEHPRSLVAGDISLPIQLKPLGGHDAVSVLVERLDKVGVPYRRVAVRLLRQRDLPQVVVGTLDTASVGHHNAVADVFASDLEPALVVGGNDDLVAQLGLIHRLRFCNGFRHVILLNG